jgi:hypothetical protein
MIVAKQEELEAKVSDEMQKELYFKKKYNTNNDRCIALTKKYERQGISYSIINKFKELYK